MVRDPLYRAIEKRLGEHLDPELFERCAADLLRRVYPGLVPIRGGDDRGMDGAIADSRARSPIPLVTTISDDVTGNLTRNLRSYRGDGGTAIEAVLATSQPLTARKRRNLQGRATEYDFTLRQIHDQADFVGRLYRDPAWRRDLLGLTGDPPALSVFPRSARPWPATELLGRDGELAKLRFAEGDVIVSGQPGVGKTALLSAMANEGLGLFAVSTDSGRIADALRELRPQRVFVDDAHLDEARDRDTLLGKLAWLRDELGAEFRITATAWPSHADDVRRMLHPLHHRVISVGPLAREVVAEIVRQVDPRFGDESIGEILDQANEGPRRLDLRRRVRPGLAVTLARWVSQGDIKHLVDGGLLLARLKKDIRMSNTTLDALAAFALGGRSGMALTAAARTMGMSETEMRTAVRPMSGTGVIREIENDLIGVRAVSVTPAALRHSLVRRTYFAGALSKSLAPAIDEVEDAVACTETLIGVLARGGRVPHDLIRSRLGKHDEAGVGKPLWDDYARTGAAAVGWILQEHPKKSALVSEAALKLTPDRALDQLVSDIVHRRGDRDALTDQIMQWALWGRHGSGNVGRRSQLLTTLARHRDLALDASEGPPAMGNWGEAVAELVKVVFALHFASTDGDPIAEEEFKIKLGSLSASDVRQLGRLWPKALSILRTVGDSGVSSAREVLRLWCAGPRVLNELPETRHAARREVVHMLPMVIELAGEAPGIVLWAHRLVRAHGLRVALPVSADPTLNRLFPVLRELAPEERSAQRFQHVAHEFALEWGTDEPGAVIERMLHYERQRQLLDHHYPDILKLIPNSLSQHVDDPSRWLEGLVEHDAPGDWVWSFLEAAVVVDPSSAAPWTAIARRERYADVSAHFGPTVAGLPPGAVQQVMAAVSEHANSLTGLPWRRVPDEWKRRLLDHTDPRVRGAAATGLWEEFHRSPEGALAVLWRTAVVECGEPDLLREVLPSDSDVARAWVLHKARASAALKAPDVDDEPSPSQTICPKAQALEIMDGVAALDRLGLDEDLVCTACGRLTIEDRRDLILAIPSDADVMFFGHLVGLERSLYVTLLRRQLPREAHLAPLRQAPPDDREGLIQLAEKHGYASSGIVPAEHEW